MISLPVVLLPAGGQTDIPGAGGEPPGPDDTSAGGEVFQGLLQQMMFGAALQGHPGDPAANAGGGSPEPETALTSGFGGSAGSRLSLGAPVNGPPGLVGAGVFPEGFVFGTASASGIIPELTVATVKDSAQVTTQNTDRAGNTSGTPAMQAGSYHDADMRAAQRAATAGLSEPLLPGIPVSGKEGDVPPTRVQEDAPAALKDDGKSVTAQMMLRSLQHGVSSAGTDSGVEPSGMSHTLPGATIRFSSQEGAVSDAAPREVDGMTIQQLSGGNSASQEHALNADAGDRNQFLFATALTVPGASGSSHGLALAGKAAEMFSPLPPDTARSVAEQVIKGFMMHMSGDRSEVHVKLQPESLGEVILHVRMEEGKMQAQIDVSQSGVKAALESALPQLRLSLSERGIDVQRLDVWFGGDRSPNASGGGRGEGYARHGFRESAEEETFGQYATGRLLGYNTLELVM